MHFPNMVTMLVVNYLHHPGIEPRSFDCETKSLPLLHSMIASGPKSVKWLHSVVRELRNCVFKNMAQYYSLLTSTSREGPDISPSLCVFSGSADFLFDGRCV